MYKKCACGQHSVGNEICVRVANKLEAMHAQCCALVLVRILLALTHNATRKYSKTCTVKSCNSLKLQALRIQTTLSVAVAALRWTRQRQRQIQGTSNELVLVATGSERPFACSARFFLSSTTRHQSRWRCVFLKAETSVTQTVDRQTDR